MKLTFLLLFPTLLWAQSSSEHFTLTKSILDVGGGASSSANFNLVSAFGQPTPVGVQASEHFTLYAGFLTPSPGVSQLSPIQELVIKDSGLDAVLHWEAISGAGSYSIHRDLGLNFVPAPGNLIGTTSNTTYTDTGVLSGMALQQYYIVIVNAP